MKLGLNTKRPVMRQDAEVDDGVFHVTQRAPGRELMFVEEEDYLTFLRLLKRTSQKTPIEINAFALMPNHVHLMVKDANGALGLAMKTLFQSYAQIFNKKYKRKGHVVCGTYRARYCGDTTYLLNVSLYIHLNPFKAGLADDMYSYRWSSLSCYTNNRVDSFVNAKPVFALFENTRDPRRSYKLLINDIKEIRCKNILTDKNAMRSFNRELTKCLDTMRGRYGFSRAIIKMIDDNIIIKRAGRDKKGRSHFKDKNALRYSIEQLKSQQYSMAEIAEALNIHRATIYRVLKSEGEKKIVSR